MKHSKEDLIKYRVQRAYESLNEAKLLAENHLWNTVANRLYYSCFYIFSALFSKFDILSKSHSGTKNEFHKSFIKSGIFQKERGEPTAIYSIKGRKVITRIFILLKKKMSNL